MNYSWFTKSTNINTPDTIHQILAFGTLSDIKSLKEKIGKNKLKNIFVQNPRKIYTAALFNFIKNIVLDINVSIDESKYLKYAPRNIR